MSVIQNDDMKDSVRATDNLHPVHMGSEMVAVLK